MIDERSPVPCHGPEVESEAKWMRWSVRGTDVEYSE